MSESAKVLKKKLQLLLKIPSAQNLTTTRSKGNTKDIGVLILQTITEPYTKKRLKEMSLLPTLFR